MSTPETISQSEFGSSDRETTSSASLTRKRLNDGESGPTTVIDTTGDSGDQAQSLAQLHNETALYVFRKERAAQLAYAREREEKHLAARCASCGELISDERLEAVPEATRCLKCQSIFDRQKNRLWHRNSRVRT